MQFYDWICLHQHKLPPFVPLLTALVKKHISVDIQALTSFTNLSFMSYKTLTFVMGNGYSSGTYLMRG